MKTVIMLSGFKSSGKDTVANILSSKANETSDRLALADDIKKICSIIFNVPFEVMDGKTPANRKAREQLIETWSDIIPGFTSRTALTTIGTDILRKHFHNDIWIINTVKKIKDSESTVFFITDLREPNEESKMKRMLDSNEYNIVHFNIHRRRPEWYDVALKAVTSNNRAAIEELNRVGVHESEWKQVGLKPDYIINNTSDVGMLVGLVDEAINHFNLKL